MRTLSPLPWLSTVATTFAVSTYGAPMVTEDPAPTRSTWVNSTLAPWSASSFSIRTTAPSWTRYCLPPVAITAYIFGTPRAAKRGRKRAGDCTAWAVQGQTGALPRRRAGPEPKPPALGGPHERAALRRTILGTMAHSFERLMTLEQIRGLVTADFEAVDRVVKQRLHSQVALVDQVATYIIYSGGKRLRPLLVLLAARASGQPRGRHIDAAAIIEFIHTATLLHDDVVDGSSLRRGRETANEVFGNAASVLVGDFLYSRSFQMMV